jgi:circadian clock protein KaiC
VVADLASRLDFRRLTNLLQAQSAILGCTTVLLINRDPDEIGDVATHADGLIDVRQELIGSRRVRTLQVVKLRGANHLGGRHEFTIGPDGITVFPRLEAALGDTDHGAEPDETRIGTGVPSLDAMLGGGLLPGSSTLLMGTPGAGKTLTGLHLVVAGARRGERGLIAGFHERPQRLIRAAARIGLDLAGAVDSGLVRILWRPPLELSPDAWAWALLDVVAEHRPTRLIVDAITDIERRIPGPDRPPDFIAALTSELRGAGVTALFNAELSTLIGPELRVPLPAVSVALDNMILLRYVELHARLERLISILKVRESAFDPAIRGFVISDQGIAIGEPVSGAAALLTGAPIPTLVVAGEP